MFWLLFLFTFSTASAQNFFVYSAKSIFLFPDNKMQVKMHYDLSGITTDNFKMKINSSEGVSKIILDETYYHSESLWLNQSNLAEEFEIKLSGNFVTTEVWFQILDTTTHQMYETPKQKFINFLFFKNYIERLNENLLSGKMTE